jgi:3-hydroxyisobutyrate dehydrogenase-like beta-hydroxyacid dehydrogenase
MATEPAVLRVGQVGYGEVGGIFATALTRRGDCEVAAYDILVSNAAWAQAARSRAEHEGVTLAQRLEEAVAGADLVVSAVTAAQAMTAAEQIARTVKRGAFVLDVNSASPRTKRECARMVERAGARYVEAAIMASVPPYGLRVPMLLGGPNAQELAPTLARLGFDAPFGSAQYGVVSAIKLCRSVVIKGMEALAVEGLIAARRYGVEAEVLASLAETFPNFDWDRQGSYYWRRVVQHGKRRSEEMREAAVTMEDVGLPGSMASASADVQAWIAGLKAQGVFEGVAKDGDWREFADRIENEAGAEPKKRAAK